MTTMTANTTPALGFNLGLPKHALIIVVCAQPSLPPTAPQSLTCRKAGGDQQEY
jgi:hypothetical protein